MDENNKPLEMSPEEQKAEQEATMEVTDDEILAEVAEQYGIDPDDEDYTDFLNKAVEREKYHRERLSGAIKQKIKYRNIAESARTSEKPKENPTELNANTKIDPQEVERIATQKAMELLEERDLKALQLPEEVVEEVKELAKVRKMTVIEASELPYIKSRIEEIKKVDTIANSSPGRSNKGKRTIETMDVSKPLSIDNFKTADGKLDVEAWDEAMAARERYKQQNR